MNFFSPGAWQVITAVFEAICTATATGCAVYVALRDSRWRKNGLARQLSDRITTAQTAADRWHETAPAVALKAEQDRQGDELLRHAGELAHTATKQDLARVEGMVGRVEGTVNSAKAGVDRIEGMLIRRALNPERAG